MANLILKNIATGVGVYDGEPLSPSYQIEVLLVNDVTLTMTAAKTRWADNLANTYTVTIHVDGDDDFELGSGSVIAFSTDAFDASVTLDADSVAVTGNTPSDIAVTGNALTLNLTEAITSAQDTVITFDINKV